MSGVTLGVVAICKNEERDLPGFLNHLLPWVDEIVIMDDGSTDRSREIAEAAGEKVKFIVSPRAKGEYYAHQRNKGIDASTSDWLLHMDIDERVSPELAVEILRAIRSKEYDAYRFRRINYFLHRHAKRGGLTDWNQVHLAKRDVLRFSGMYHESVHLSVDEGRVGQLKNFMLHLNDETYAERLQKSSSYQFEYAQRMQDQGISMSGFGILRSFVQEFVYLYFWKLGCLDGTIGLIWALHSAMARARAAILVWDQQNRIPRRVLEEEIEKAWSTYGLENVMREKTRLQVPER